MKIVVTGATGYIGERLVQRALASGHDVIALSRRELPSSGCAWIFYDLSSDQPPTLPGDIDVVLHLALDTSPEAQADGVQEVCAAQLLIDTVNKVGARLIFVSSQTARADAPTTYGRTKWQIEQKVLAAGGCVVRPGQVYGGGRRGLFGNLIGMTKRLPFLPAFIPAPRVQPIHIDDLITCLLHVSKDVENYQRVLSIGAVQPVAFTEFLRRIAHDRLRVRRCFVPIPASLILSGLRLIGKSGEAARLHSLFDLPVMETASDLQAVGLNLRPLHSGMHPAGDNRRRLLFLEGQALLSYVLRNRAGCAILRRYVRAIEMLRDGRTLDLPVLLVRLPAFLALVDQGPRNGAVWQKEFAWRLDAATVIAEANPMGAKRFLGQGRPCGFVRSAMGLALAVAAEIVWRVLGMLFTPVIRLIYPHAFKGWQ